MSQRLAVKSFADTVMAAFMLPLLLPFVFTSERKTIHADVALWLVRVRRKAGSRLGDFLKLLAIYPEFRSLYYFRLRRGNLPGALASLPVKWIYRGQDALFVEAEEVGPGLFLQHAFATIVAAKKIGRDCWINQQVTIGFRDDTHGPILGDNVKVKAGAKVIGPIRIGNNVTIGANAVVVKDVPDDCVVVGVPARIVRRGGVRVNEPL
jgi:serine O-acetyltransferase